MKKYRLILIDTLILCLVSTLLAYGFNAVASALKGKAQEDDLIVTAIIQDNFKDLEKFVKAGPDATNKTDEFGRSALMRTAYVNFSNASAIDKTDAKRVGMVELLVKHGARLDARDNDGWSALMWASWSGLTKGVSRLLELGASPQFADRQGNTALLIAAQRGNAEIVKALLAKGADKAAANNAGITALDAAKTGMTQYPDKAPGYHAILSQLR